MKPQRPTPKPAADSGERMSPKELAAARRDAMRLRARRIRRSVAGLAGTLFVVAFLVVYVQLASGNDPALKAAAARSSSSSSNLTASQSSGSSSSTEGSGASESSSSGTESTGSSSEGTQSTEEPASVTTSQS